MKPIHFTASITLLLCLSATLSACGHKDQADVRSNEKGFELEPQNGELSKDLNKILKDQWAEDCDRKLSQKAIELVTLFDTQAERIAEFSKTLPPPSYIKTIPFGDSFLAEYIPFYSPKPEWQTFNESWEEAYQYYLSIQDEPFSQKWLILNSSVRSLITNDRKRVLGGVNLQLHHDSGPALQNLSKKLKTCLNDSSCSALDLSFNERAWVRNIEFYRFYLDQLEKNPGFNSFRDLLTRFDERVSSDLTYYEFRLNPSITSSIDATGNQILTLPLEGSGFNESQRGILQSYIESMWRTDGLKVVIDWRNEWSKDIFKIFFDPLLIGTRAYVAPLKREMHLFALTATQAIPHETGHVLGFTDHYYMTWDSTRCQYSNETNDLDLMSGHVTGKVTPEEWDELRAHYLKAKKKMGLTSLPQ